jgi:hypothetical protein
MGTRRNFFKYLGLAGGVATGGVVAAAAVLPDTEKCEAVKQIKAADYNNKLSIGAEYGRIAPTDNNGGIFSYGNPRFVPGTQKQVAVSMIVGPDGEMYLLTNGKWRRIVTE